MGNCRTTFLLNWNSKITGHPPSLYYGVLYWNVFLLLMAFRLSWLAQVQTTCSIRPGRHTDASLPSLSVPPALFPHDTTEKEGAGSRGGLQQSGVTWPHSDEWLREKEPIKTKRGGTKTQEEENSKSQPSFPPAPVRGAHSPSVTGDLSSFNLLMICNK